MGVCAKLILHVYQSTQKKRLFLEQVHRDGHNLGELKRELRRARERNISQQMRKLPGKLDHATVVAFQVGHFSSGPLNGQASGKRRGSLLTDLFSRLSNRRT